MFWLYITLPCGHTGSQMAIAAALTYHTTFISRNVYDENILVDQLRNRGEIDGCGLQFIGVGSYGSSWDGNQPNVYAAMDISQERKMMVCISLQFSFSLLSVPSCIGDFCFPISSTGTRRDKESSH